MIETMHPDLRKRMEDQRHREEMQYAANWRLLYRSRKRAQHWLSTRFCALLCQFGRLLIWSGRRLQEAGALQSS